MRETAGKRAVSRVLLLTLRIANRPHTAQYGTVFSRLTTRTDFSLPLRPHLWSSSSFPSTTPKAALYGPASPWIGIDKLFHDQMILDALYTTLAVSVLAAVIATVAGTFAAIGFYNMKKRWRTPLMTVNNIPMVNAEIVTGVSLCLFFVAAFSTCGGILPTGSTEPSGSSCPSSCTWASAPCSSPTSPSTSPM